MIQAYATMLPRLEAQRALQWATIVAVGSGAMKKADSRRVMNQWRRRAGAGQAQRVTDIKTAAAQLQAVGFTRG